MRVQREGFVRVRVDGVVCDVKDAPVLAKTKKHDISVVVDRLILKDEIRVRLADSIETALKIGEGTLTVMFQEASDEWVDVVYSEKFACTKHP